MSGNNRIRDLFSLDRRGVRETSSELELPGREAKIREARGSDETHGPDAQVLDSELARAPELHRDIEASVRRSMTAPDLSGLLEKIDRAAAQMRQGGRASVEGSIRWVAAAFSLLFLLLAMCASTLVTVPQAETHGVPSAHGNWRVSLAQAMGLSLATASAVVASGAKLGRRGRHGSGRVDESQDARLSAGDGELSWGFPRSSEDAGPARVGMTAATLSPSRAEAPTENSACAAASTEVSQRGSLQAIGLDAAGLRRRSRARWSSRRATLSATSPTGWRVDEGRRLRRVPAARTLLIAA